MLEQTKEVAKDWVEKPSIYGVIEITVESMEMITNSIEKITRAIIYIQVAQRMNKIAMSRKIETKAKTTQLKKIVNKAALEPDPWERKK